MKKFTIERFKKDGSSMSSVKVIKGIWIDPHTEEQYKKNLEQNEINKQNGIKERFIYYPGTRVPHIHLMEIRKVDVYNQMVGGPSPWTDSTTIKLNIPLIETENIYQKLLEAKKENNKERIKFLTSPLAEWYEPTMDSWKKMYPMAMHISNRNDKSDFVYENLERFEEAIKKLEEIYLKDRIKTVRGICALINLLSSKFAFRVGNQLDKKNTGIGITTFRKDNIYTDEKGYLHFKFKGKKGVNWHKKFKPSNDLEQYIYDDLILLKQDCIGNEYSFLFCYNNGKRVDSCLVNNLFREVMNVKENEKDYLSFHSWRHYNASKSFIKLLSKIDIEKDIKKIEEKKDINTNLKKGRLITKEINKIFKEVSPILNDTIGVVRNTYSGGKIFKSFYEKYGLEFDEKKRTWNKGVYSDELNAERTRRGQRKKENKQCINYR